MYNATALIRDYKTFLHSQENFAKYFADTTILNLTTDLPVLCLNIRLYSKYFSKTQLLSLIADKKALRARDP